MMNFLELAKKRRSVRSYTSQTVEDEKLHYLLECARLAPSAVNRQPWHFFVVKSEEKKHRLRQCYARDWFAQAPLYIVICADDANAWVRQADGKNHADIDAAIAIEHLCLAAADLGLGTCWVCNFDVVKCSELLALPSNQRPVAILPVGYPDHTDVKRSVKKELSEVMTEV